MKKELKGVADKLREVGENVPGAKFFDGLNDGLSKTKASINDVRAAMKNLRDAGDGGPLDAGVLSAGAEAAEALSGKLEGVRNAGLGVAAIGAGGIALTGSLAEAAGQSIALQTRLESILKSQQRLGDLGSIQTAITQTTEEGHFDVSGAGQIKEAAAYMAALKVPTQDIIKVLPRLAALSRTTGQEVGEMVENWSEGFKNASFEDLEELGIFPGEAAKKELDDVKKSAGDAAAQIKFMEVFLRETETAARGLAGSLSENEAAANDAARAASDFQTNVGTGAAQAKAEIAGLGSSLLGIINHGPGLQQTAGYLGTYGSYAMAGVGSLIAFGAQLGQLFIGIQALRAARALDATATNASTAATATNTGAQVVNAGASTANASASTVRAGATTAASAATGANTAATEINTAAQIRARIATMGVYAGITLIAVAAAATVGAVGHSIAQHIGWIDKEQGFLDRLTAGWERLKGMISGTKVEWAQNETDLAAGIEKVKADNAKAVLSGKKTQAQADKDNIAEEIKLRETFAREQMRIGDDANLVKNQEAAARLKQQQGMTDPATAALQTKVAELASANQSLATAYVAPTTATAAATAPTPSSLPAGVVPVAGLAGGALVPAMPGVTTAATGARALPTTQSAGGFNIAQLIAQTLMGGGSIGAAAVNTRPTRPNRANSMGIYREGDREVFRAKNRVSQGTRSTRVEFDPIEIPNQSVSSLAGDY